MANDPTSSERSLLSCVQAAVMAERLTDLVTTKLLSVRDVFHRLDADRVGELLSPGVDRISEQIVSDMLPGNVASVAGPVGRAALRGLPEAAQEELMLLRHEYVAGLTRDMQKHVDEILDVKEVVSLLLDLLQASKNP